MKQIVLKYRGFTWKSGSHYTLEFADRETIDVYRPLFRPVTWMYGGEIYKLKCGSNTSSALYTDDKTKIGEIHESSRHWDITVDGCRYQLHMLKRGFVLKSKLGFIATVRLNAIRRITCTYTDMARIPMASLIYIVVYLRISLD